VAIKALFGDDEGVALIGEKIVVGGWVKTGRTAEKGSRSPLFFITLEPRVE
jgi:hypothetical protein